MAARSRSISKQIHWSSLLRAAIFAAAWWWLPFWIFVLVACYLYFVPWFRPGKLAVPFFALLLLAYLESAPSIGIGLWLALIFGAIFYCILLVKDLIVLDRQSLYEVVILALAFFFLRGFYAAFSEGIGGSAGTGSAALFYAFIVAAIIAILVRSFLGAFPGEARKGRALARTASWLSFLLFAQICIVGLFLPLDFTYQSIIVFLVVVFMVELLAEYFFMNTAGPSRKKILGIASTVFALLVIVLSSAHWGL